MTIGLTPEQEMFARLRAELADSYDEELEMELDDRMASGEDHGSDESKAARQQYFQELFRLQGELVKLQDWVVATGHRMVVIFEGCESAGFVHRDPRGYFDARGSGHVVLGE